MKSKIIALVVCLLILTGCSFINPIESDWNIAKRNNHKWDYIQYLNKYPDGPHSDEARMVLDEMYYKDVKENNEHPSNYLGRFPNGKHADEVRFILAKHKNTLIDYNDFLKKCPDGPFAEKARKIVQSIESQFSAIDSRNKNHPNSTAIIEDWRGNIIEVVGNIKFTNVCMREIQFLNGHMWKTKQLLKFPGLGISSQRWGLTNVPDMDNNYFSAIDIYLPPESVFKYDLSVVDRVMYFRNQKKVSYYKLLNADSQRYIQGKSITGEFKLDLYTIKRFQKFDDQPAIDFSVPDNGQRNNKGSNFNVILTSKRCGKLGLGKIYLRVGLCAKPGYTYNPNFCRKNYAFENIPLKVSDKKEAVKIKFSNIHSLSTLRNYSDKKRINIITRNGVTLTGTIDFENMNVPMDNDLENICGEGIIGEGSHGSYLFVPFREIVKMQKIGQ